MHTIIPANYKSGLSLYRTQEAIALIKEEFQKNLSEALNLMRVSGPLFVDGKSGLNDNLNGVEHPVGFYIRCADTEAEVVHSLAKWKRFALGKYGFKPGSGLYTDMNAIRRDEDLDNLHSVYVDQWDWEQVITRRERTVTYLKSLVNKIVCAICDTADKIKSKYGHDSGLSRNVTFITSAELEALYPDLPPKEREKEFMRTHGTAFIMQIGKKLPSGQVHDGRAPDYDDWELNGDIVFYYPLLDCPFEVSSMGIRVDKDSLLSQLKIAGCEERLELPFHKALVNDELPLTAGGGIGQSRLCMLLLGKAHIGEVQCSVWDTETVESCKKAGIVLL